MQFRMKDIDVKAALLLVAVCTTVGVAIQHFTGFFWLTAALLSLALLLINGLIIYNEDLAPGGFDFQEGVTNTFKARFEQRRANRLHLAIICIVLLLAAWSYMT